MLQLLAAPLITGCESRISQRCYKEIIMNLINSLISGLSLGSVYAIIALGYTMVYGISKMLNFAHGDVIMVGGYVSFILTMYVGFNGWIALLMAMAACTILGILIERLAYRPLRGTGSLAVLITAIGVSYFLQNSALLIWGANPRVFTSLFNGIKPFHLADGQLTITAESLFTILVSFRFVLPPAGEDVGLPTDEGESICPLLSLRARPQPGAAILSHSFAYSSGCWL